MTGTLTSPRRIRWQQAVLVILSTGAFQAISLGLESYLRTHAVVDLQILQLRLGYNTGVAFSLGASWPPAVLITVTGLLTAGLGVLLIVCSPALTMPVRIAGAAVVAGALSNLTDRALRGAVTDYVWTGWFATFNLADVGITLGAATVIVSTLLHRDDASPTEIAEVPSRRDGA